MEGRPLEDERRSDADLIERARGGEIVAYEELVRRYQDVAIRTAHLIASERDAEARPREAFGLMLDGTAVDGVAATPDGSIFALLQADGRVVALDPTTGRTLGSVPGSGFDRLLATSAW